MCSEEDSLEDYNEGRHARELVKDLVTLHLSAEDLKLQSCDEASKCRAFIAKDEEAVYKSFRKPARAVQFEPLKDDHFRVKDDHCRPCQLKCVHDVNLRPYQLNSSDEGNLRSRQLKAVKDEVNFRLVHKECLNKKYDNQNSYVKECWSKLKHQRCTECFCKKNVTKNVSPQRPIKPNLDIDGSLKKMSSTKSSRATIVALQHNVTSPYLQQRSSPALVSSSSILCRSSDDVLYKPSYSNNSSPRVLTKDLFRITSSHSAASSPRIYHVNATERLLLGGAAQNSSFKNNNRLPVSSILSDGRFQQFCQSYSNKNMHTSNEDSSFCSNASQDSCDDIQPSNSSLSVKSNGAKMQSLQRSLCKEVLYTNIDKSYASKAKRSEVISNMKPLQLKSPPGTAPLPVKFMKKTPLSDRSPSSWFEPPRQMDLVVPKKYKIPRSESSGPHTRKKNSPSYNCNVSDVSSRSRLSKSKTTAIIHHCSSDKIIEKPSTCDTVRSNFEIKISPSKVVRQPKLKHSIYDIDRPIKSRYGKRNDDPLDDSPVRLSRPRKERENSTGQLDEGMSVSRTNESFEFNHPEVIESSSSIPPKSLSGFGLKQGNTFETKESFESNSGGFESNHPEMLDSSSSSSLPKSISGYSFGRALDSSTSLERRSAACSVNSSLEVLADSTSQCLSSSVHDDGKMSSCLRCVILSYLYIFFILIY